VEKTISFESRLQDRLIITDDNMADVALRPTVAMNWRVYPADVQARAADDGAPA
jgi:hypothetical protein